MLTFNSNSLDIFNCKKSSTILLNSQKNKNKNQYVIYMQTMKFHCKMSLIVKLSLNSWIDQNCPQFFVLSLYKKWYYKIICYSKCLHGCHCCDRYKKIWRQNICFLNLFINSLQFSFFFAKRIKTFLFDQKSMDIFFEIKFEFNRLPISMHHFILFMCYF